MNGMPEPLFAPLVSADDLRELLHIIVTRGPVSAQELAVALADRGRRGCNLDEALRLMRQADAIEELSDGLIRFNGRFYVNLWLTAAGEMANRATSGATGVSSKRQKRGAQ